MTGHPDPFTLELVASMLERRQGNSLYRAAWRSAAKLVRNLKSDVDVTILNDGGEQITMISSRPVSA